MSASSIQALQGNFNVQKNALLNAEQNYINATKNIDPSHPMAQSIFDRYTQQYNDDVAKYGGTVNDVYSRLDTEIKATDPNDKAAYDAAQLAKASMASGVKEMHAKIAEANAAGESLLNQIKNPKIPSATTLTNLKESAVTVEGKIPELIKAEDLKLPAVNLPSLTSIASSAPGVANITNAAKKLNIPGLKVEGLTKENGSLMGSDGVSEDGIQQVKVTGQRIRNTKDFRVRISPQSDALDQVYGPLGENNILTPLRATQGLMFPYTPSISWNQSVEYASTSLTHSNQDAYTYKNTPSTMISIDGEFTVQNQREGEYLLAVMHFLRTVSKMYFGKASFAAPSSGQPSLAGMPPPVLILSGYGDYMFNELPVIVKDHSYSFKDNISYVDITTAGSTVRLPAIMSISVKLIVQNTPKRNRNEFDLNKFRTGELMKKGGWI